MSISFLTSLYDDVSKEGKIEIETLKHKTGVWARERAPSVDRVQGVVKNLFDYMKKAGDTVVSQELFDHYASIFRDAYSQSSSLETISKLNALSAKFLQMADDHRLDKTSLEKVLPYDAQAVAEELRRPGNTAPILKKIGDQTRACYTLGWYPVSGREVHLNRDLLLQSQRDTKMCTREPSLKPQKGVKTVVEVKNMDTVSAAIALQKEGKKVALLSMANPGKPGGSFVDGGPAQEEDLCRCSTLYHALGENPQLTNKSGLYHQAISRTAVLYTPSVQFFRGPRGAGYPFLEAPLSFDVISAAGFDRRAEHPKDKEYSEITKEMVRNTLRAAASAGNKVLVLGALGCGAFRGFDKTASKIPETVAKIFSDVLKEKEFSGAFEKIVFAIYDPQKETIPAFEEKFKKWKP